MGVDVVTDEETQYSSTSSGGTGGSTTVEEEAQHLTRSSNNLYHRWSAEIGRIKSRLDRHLFSVVKRTQNRVDSVFACQHVLLESSDDGFTSEDNETTEKQRMFMKRRKMLRLKQAAAKQCPIAVSDLKTDNRNDHDTRFVKSSTPTNTNHQQHDQVSALQFDPKAKGYITLASPGSLRSESRSTSDKTLRSTSDKTAHLSNLTKHVEERRQQQLAVNFEIIEEQDDVSDPFRFELDYAHETLTNNDILAFQEAIMIDPTPNQVEVRQNIKVKEAKSDLGSLGPTSSFDPELFLNDLNELNQSTMEIRSSPVVMARLSVDESGASSQQSRRKTIPSNDEGSNGQESVPLLIIETPEATLRRISSAPSSENHDIILERSFDLRLSETPPPPQEIINHPSKMSLGDSDSLHTPLVDRTSDELSTANTTFSNTSNTRKAPDPDGALSSRMADRVECISSCELDTFLVEDLVDSLTSSKLDLDPVEKMSPLDGNELRVIQAASIESTSFGEVRSAVLNDDDDDAQKRGRPTTKLTVAACKSPLLGPPEQMSTLTIAKLTDGSTKKRSPSKKSIGCGKPEDVADLHEEECSSEMVGTTEIYLNDIHNCTSDLTWFTHDRPLSTIIVVKRKQAGADEPSSQPRNFAPESIAEESQGTNDDGDIHETAPKPPSDLRYGTEIPLTDPNGDHGFYTGVLLRETPSYFGEMIYPRNGKFYKGTWQNGMWNGIGQVVFANGDTYSGQFVNDIRQGTGRYCWADGRIYDGGFVNNKRDGIGTYYWPDGSVYAGGFQNGSRHGEGVLVFHDRSVYCGEWVNGRQEGLGECVWNDGRYYKGEWKEGQVHGQGIEVRMDGTIRHEGEWKCGRPIRTRQHT